MSGLHRRRQSPYNRVVSDLSYRTCGSNKATVFVCNDHVEGDGLSDNDVQLLFRISRHFKGRRDPEAVVQSGAFSMSRTRMPRFRRDENGRIPIQHVFCIGYCFPTTQDAHNFARALSGTKFRVDVRPANSHILPSWVLDPPYESNLHEVPAIYEHMIPEPESDSESDASDGSDLTDQSDL